MPKNNNLYDIYIVFNDSVEYTLLKKDLDREACLKYISDIAEIKYSMLKVTFKNHSAISINKNGDNHDVLLDGEMLNINRKTLRKNVSKTNYISHSELLNTLLYTPSTGVFTHHTLSNHTKHNKIAGGINKLGYVQINIKGKIYLGHRLAVYYMTGVMPKGRVLHINKNKSDNRYENLEVR